MRRPSEICAFQTHIKWPEFGKKGYPITHALSSIQNASPTPGAQTYGWIIGLDGAHCGEDFRVTEGEQTLGSGWQSQIVLTTPEVSRTHALLKGNNQIVKIEDLNSAKGIYVNNQKVNSAVLQDGDVLRFGVSEFYFRSAFSSPNVSISSSNSKSESTSSKVGFDKKKTWGWLLPQNGEYQGMDFRLIFEENKLGASLNLDLTIIGVPILPHHLSIFCTKKSITLKCISPENKILFENNELTEAVLTDSCCFSINQMEFLVRCAE